MTGAPLVDEGTFANWLFRFTSASVLRLAVRVWLGYQWLNAGYQKIWGSEKIGFWYGGVAGVYGFAKTGVAANSHPYGCRRLRLVGNVPAQPHHAELGLDRRSRCLSASLLSVSA